MLQLAGDASACSCQPAQGYRLTCSRSHHPRVFTWSALGTETQSLHSNQGRTKATDVFTAFKVFKSICYLPVTWLLQSHPRQAWCSPRILSLDRHLPLNSPMGVWGHNTDRSLAPWHRAATSRALSSLWTFFSLAPERHMPWGDQKWKRKKKRMLKMIQREKGSC